MKLMMTAGFGKRIEFVFSKTVTGSWEMSITDKNDKEAKTIKFLIDADDRKELMEVLEFMQ